MGLCEGSGCQKGLRLGSIDPKGSVLTPAEPHLGLSMTALQFSHQSGAVWWIEEGVGARGTRERDLGWVLRSVSGLRDPSYRVLQEQVRVLCLVNSELLLSLAFVSALHVTSVIVFILQKIQENTYCPPSAPVVRLVESGGVRKIVVVCPFCGLLHLRGMQVSFCRARWLFFLVERVTYSRAYRTFRLAFHGRRL